MLTFLLTAVLTLVSLFLIALILVQRGRGGGLAGALGGMGGQSAFGTKAGDVFTRATIVVAAVWILLCALLVKIETAPGGRLSNTLGSARKTTRPVEAAATTADSSTTAPSGSDARPPLESSTAPPAESEPPLPTEATAPASQPAEAPPVGQP